MPAIGLYLFSPYQKREHSLSIGSSLIDVDVLSIVVEVTVLHRHTLLPAIPESFFGRNNSVNGMDLAIMADRPATFIGKQPYSAFFPPMLARLKSVKF